MMNMENVVIGANCEICPDSSACFFGDRGTCVLDEDSKPIKHAEITKEDSKKIVDAFIEYADSICKQYNCDIEDVFAVIVTYIKDYLQISEGLELKVYKKLREAMYGKEKEQNPTERADEDNTFGY